MNKARSKVGKKKSAKKSKSAAKSAVSKIQKLESKIDLNEITESLNIKKADQVKERKGLDAKNLKEDHEIDIKVKEDLKQAGAKVENDIMKQLELIGGFNL